MRGLAPNGNSTSQPNCEALLRRMSAGPHRTAQPRHNLTGEALLPRMSAGPPPNGRRKTRPPEGSRYEVKRADGTPALRKGSCGRNDVRDLTVRVGFDCESHNTRA